jgi:hypothetical protein
VTGLVDAQAVLNAHAEVMRAMATGKLTVDEAEPICVMLTGRIKLIETVD